MKRSLTRFFKVFFISLGSVLGIIVLLFALIILVTVTFSGREKSIQTDGGMSEYQIRNELTNTTKLYLDHQLMALKIGAPTDMQPTYKCLIYEDVGGVWDPPAPEQQCSVSYRVPIHEFTISDSKREQFLAFLETAKKQSEEDGFYPRDCGENQRYNGHEYYRLPCFLAQHGQDGRGKQLTPLCTLEANTDMNPKERTSGLDNYYLEIKCKVRAQIDFVN